MFLQLSHSKLDVYKLSCELVCECYLITSDLPVIERFNLVQQIRRASISVKLNIAEGSSRKSNTERKRYYEIARGSVVEIDAAIEVCYHLKYVSYQRVIQAGELINRVYAILSRMIS